MSRPDRFNLSPVLIASVISLLLFVVLTITFQPQVKTSFDNLRNWVCEFTGWLFIFGVQVFLVLSIYLAVSRFKHIKLGGDAAKPAFSYLSWISMMFSAGLGIGLVFWSVAEPIFHFSDPPLGTALSRKAAINGMGITFMHWGLHAWAIYAVVGLTFAYFTYNRGKPFSISACLQELLGDRFVKIFGSSIDTVAVLATLFGVSTSLGLGAIQISSGLDYAFNIPNTLTLNIIVIVCISGLTLWSVATGLEKGVKLLSQINIGLAGALLLFVLLVGPTLFLVKGALEYSGYYLQNLIQLSTWNQTFEPDSSWQASWTIFYWAWWIAWSPFVGMFLARISYGRSIGEFIVGALVIPTVLSIIWLSVFGGAGLWEAYFSAQGSQLISNVETDVSTALFALLKTLPMANLSSILAVVVIVIFFVTSADSASIVVDTLTARGKTDTPTLNRVFWSAIQGVIATVLLIGGGLSALQTASIILGLPFLIILFLLCFSLIYSLHSNYPKIETNQNRR